MVAVIKTGSSLHRIFNYNEQKVKAGVAECIMAANYPKDLKDLTLRNKLIRLLNQAALNENVTRSSVHISLNFDSSEKLPHDRLREIAGAYMQKIGFGQQPYLVYQHHDAGHPHIHIVTVKVRADGSRIDTHNIGRNQSEKARKEIEQSFRLVKAEDSKPRQAYKLEPVPVQKVQYGRSETISAITNVLDAVLKTYRYTSLPELNAVLQQYNVAADRGSESSRVYQHKGLTYHILDENGKKIGLPIKASDIHAKPTLRFLEERFALNETARLPHKPRVKNAIDLALLKQPSQSLEGLIKSLEREGIHTCLRKNGEGLIYGITYVDHRAKTVFNGSALGKPYSAKAIQERCGQNIPLEQKEALQPTAIQRPTLQKQPTQTLEQSLITNPSTTIQQPPAEHTSLLPDPGKVLDILLPPEQTPDYIPNQLRKKGKKKKRKRITGHL
jgi:hypothetical protein